MALSATQRTKLAGDPELKLKAEHGTDPDEVVAPLVLLEPQRKAAFLEASHRQRKSPEQIAAADKRLPSAAQELRKELEALNIPHTADSSDSVITRIRNLTREQLEQVLAIEQVRSVMLLNKETRKGQPATARG